jgi:4-alpha-glucanotransferase
VVAGDAVERGDFVDGHYEARLRQDPQRICVQLVRQGKAAGRTVKIVKSVTLAAGSEELEVDYLLSGLPADQVLHFGVELNFAGLPVGCADRYFREGKRQTLGQLGQSLDLAKTKGVSVVDDALGLEVDLKLSRAGSLWTYPIETTSRTVTGLETIQQSVVVMPHWLVKADAKGCWRVTLKLQLDTSAAERRQTRDTTRRTRVPAAA